MASEATAVGWRRGTAVVGIIDQNGRALRTVEDPGVIGFAEAQ